MIDRETYPTLQGKLRGKTTIRIASPDDVIKPLATQYVDGLNEHINVQSNQKWYSIDYRCVDVSL